MMTALAPAYRLRATRSIWSRGRPADAQDVIPGRTAQIVAKRLEAVRVLRDERRDRAPASHAATKRRFVRFENELHHALERRDIAADAHLAIFAGDPGRAERRHLDRVLRRGKALERALAQRVQHDDRHAAPRRFAQRGHHPRAVGARVLADDEDRVGVGRNPRAGRCLCRCRCSRAGRRWSPRGTCSNSRENCWCRSAARKAGRGTPLRSRCGPRCRIPPRRVSSARRSRPIMANASSQPIGT